MYIYIYIFCACVQMAMALGACVCEIWKVEILRSSANTFLNLFLYLKVKNMHHPASRWLYRSQCILQSGLYRVSPASWRVATLQGEHSSVLPATLRWSSCGWAICWPMGCADSLKMSLGTHALRTTLEVRLRPEKIICSLLTALGFGVVWWCMSCRKYRANQTVPCHELKSFSASTLEGI